MNYDSSQIFPKLEKFISSAIDATNFSNDRIEYIKNKNIHHTDINDILKPINNILDILLPDRIIPSNPGRVELEWIFEGYRLRIEIVPKRERYNFKILPTIDSNLRGELGSIVSTNELIIFLLKHIIGIEEVERLQRNNKNLCIQRAKDLPML